MLDDWWRLIWLVVSHLFTIFTVSSLFHSPATRYSGGLFDIDIEIPPEYPCPIFGSAESTRSHMPVKKGGTMLGVPEPICVRIHAFLISYAYMIYTQCIHMSRNRFRICIYVIIYFIYTHTYQPIEKQKMLPNGCPSAVSSHGHPQQEVQPTEDEV